MDLREALEAMVARVAELLAAGLDLEPPGDAALLEPGELEQQLASHASSLFLGVYDEALARAQLEASGLLPAIRARAGAEVTVRIDPENGYLRVFRADRDVGPDALLVEVKARLEHTLPAGLREIGFPRGDLLLLEWLLTQDPARPFPPGRRPLPGQRHPGLGLGPQIVAATIRAARRAGAEAVIGYPMFFHNAVMYRRVFVFADPVAEGLFQALRRDLEARGLDLAASSEAVHEGRVREVVAGTGTEATRRRFEWKAQEMVLPLSAPVKEFLARPSYAEVAARALASHRFELA